MWGWFESAILRRMRGDFAFFFGRCDFDEKIDLLLSLQQYLLPSSTSMQSNTASEQPPSVSFKGEGYTSFKENGLQTWWNLD